MGGNNYFLPKGNEVSIKSDVNHETAGTKNALKCFLLELIFLRFSRNYELNSVKAPC